ncbi:hypothetical protein Tco_0667304 [Tanacetum coccineum]
MALNKTSFFALRHNQEYRHGVLAEEKMEQFGKEKSSFHDQGHQQAAKGKENDDEFGEIHWFDTSAGNPVKEILLKLIYLINKVELLPQRIHTRKFKDGSKFSTEAEDIAAAGCYAIIL